MIGHLGSRSAAALRVLYHPDITACYFFRSTHSAEIGTYRHFTKDFAFQKSYILRYGPFVDEGSEVMVTVG